MTTMPSVRRPALLPDGPDAVLDHAADVVRHLLAAPAAMVTVVGEQDQTFVGASGPGRLVKGTRRVPRSASFCAEVVASDEPLVVADARQDPRLRDHPALSASGAVAYCGVPLRDEDGETLGTVCAVDHLAHAWTDADVAALRSFSTLLTRDLSLRRARAEALRREALLDDTRALLSHDLRDALHTIGIAAELLPAVPGLPQRAVDLVGAIARRSAAATLLLQRLLPGSDPPGPDPRGPHPPGPHPPGPHPPGPHPHGPHPPGTGPTGTGPTGARASGSGAGAQHGEPPAPTLEARFRRLVDEYDDVLADVDVRLEADGALHPDDRVLVPQDLVDRSVAGLVRAAAAGDAPGVVDVRLSRSADGHLVVDVCRSGAVGAARTDADELGQIVAAFAADAWEGSFTAAPGHYRLALPLAARPTPGILAAPRPDGDEASPVSRTAAS